MDNSTNLKLIKVDLNRFLVSKDCFILKKIPSKEPKFISNFGIRYKLILKNSKVNMRIGLKMRFGVTSIDFNSNLNKV